MLTQDQIQKIGIPGLLLAGLIYLNGKLSAAEGRILELEANHRAFVEMLVERYHLPLTQ